MATTPHVRRFAATNRLADMIRVPGGKTVERALADGQAAVEQYRPVVIEDIDARIARLEALTAETAADGEAVYADALGVIEHAGLFGLEAVGRAAYSLCELVERLRARSLWDAESVAVHVGAIRLLRGMADQNGPESRALLAGLAAVLAKAAPQRKRRDES
jgi:hypothetical protein